ncbi:hypothetical protein ACFVT5_04020 [Streptomyces sp. NPDC058001]|uniref:hypothetical protein n=1 Tax=Streptomyces sp. NPDC058001 TaxID=3346300 RepID=UPI0036EC102C
MTPINEAVDEDVETQSDPHETPTEPSPDDAPPLLTDQLTAWVRHQPQCEQVAVAALIEEDELLAREWVRRLLVAEHDDGGISCDWLAFEARYTRAPGLTPADKAFLRLIVAVRFPRNVSRWNLEQLDERRLCIVLRAMAKLAGSDTVAVGTRV